MDYTLPHPGPWLAAQLAERFSSRRAPDELLRRGVLIRPARGIYYRADVWSTMTPDERHIALLRAHFQFHARFHDMTFAYSHVSAARLHGLHLWKPDEFIHVTVPQSRGGGRHRPEVRLHALDLPERERTTLGDLPVTSLERTIVDCARWMRRGQAQIVADHGLRMGADRHRLDALVTEAEGQRGVRQARAALALGSALSESPGESLLNYMLSRMPVPRPTQQIEVVTRCGLYRIDNGWPQLKKGLEFDGKTKYFAYAPTDEVIFKERQREKALLEEEWDLLRIDWNDLFREHELQSRITRFLARLPGRRQAAS